MSLMTPSRDGNDHDELHPSDEAQAPLPPIQGHAARLVPIPSIDGSGLELTLTEIPTITMNGASGNRRKVTPSFPFLFELGRAMEELGLEENESGQDTQDRSAEITLPVDPEDDEEEYEPELARLASANRLRSTEAPSLRLPFRPSRHNGNFLSRLSRPYSIYSPPPPDIPDLPTGPYPLPRTGCRLRLAPRLKTYREE